MLASGLPPAEGPVPFGHRWYFYAITNRNKEVVEADGVGACIPNDPNDSWQNCRPPVVTLPVTEETTTHAVRWSAFAGGLPTATRDGSDVIALQWSLRWADGAIPYAAVLTVDNLEFFTDESSDGMGSGGAGWQRGRRGWHARRGRSGRGG